VATVMVPTALRIVDIVLHKLQHQRTFLGGADLVVFLILNFSDLAVAAFLAVRGYRRSRQPQTRLSAPSATDTVSPGALNASVG
jgi:hypothetical protein